MEEKKINYEEAIEKLEEIVRDLESGGLSLENSLEKFEEGVKLVKFCNKELKKAEKKIEVVLKDRGEFKDTVSFTEELEEKQ